jgi:radical SAM protein with 4Fe4S-binding SPASM domain
MSFIRINPSIIYKNSRVEELIYAFHQRSFVRYLTGRIKWHYYPKFHIVSRFPLHVDIELSSACQMRCPMCFQTIRSDIPHGFMEFSLFKIIIDEIAEESPDSVRLSWRGECLLHPRFRDMIRYARSRYQGNISFLTNGLLLDEEIFSLLIDLDIDYIVISMDGYGPTYDEIRSPSVFKAMAEKLERFAKMKRDRRSVRPLIRINTIAFWFKGDELSRFTASLSPSIDKLLVGNLLNNFDGIEITHDPSLACSSPWQRVLIGWNGEVYPCCDDYSGYYMVGNANQQTLRAIWHDAPLTAMRKIMQGKNRLSLKLCRERDCGIDCTDISHNGQYCRALRDEVIREKGENSPLLSYFKEASDGDKISEE